MPRSYSNIVPRMKQGKFIYTAALDISAKKVKTSNQITKNPYMKNKIGFKPALEVAGAMMLGLYANNCAPTLAQKQTIVETAPDDIIDKRQAELRQMMEYYLNHQEITINADGQITAILCQIGPDAETMIDDQINQFVKPLIFEKCPYGAHEIPGETLKLKEDCEKNNEENCTTCVELTIDTPRIKCNEVPEVTPNPDHDFPDIQESPWYNEEISIQARLDQLEKTYDLTNPKKKTPGSLKKLPLDNKPDTISTAH